VTLGDQVLIIDAANVVGSRPDGWWRDRAGATERLRDEVARAVHAGKLAGFVEVVLVVEGAARAVQSIAGVRVEPAKRDGDALIAALARPGATVVTADRGLRSRVVAAGSAVIGPGALRERMRLST
jgi:8-oxo-dGTP diphosphatase